MDIRNINRNWPGRPDGLLTERTAYAAMRLIEAENVNMTVDFHEAELEYPVENTIVTHEKGNEVAAMTSMLEPLLMVFLGGVVGGMIVAMYLPIFQIGSIVG